MRLGPKFTRGVMRGETLGKWPALNDEPDLEPGKWIELRRFYVWVRPDKQDKDGLWSYTIRDCRPEHMRMNAKGPLPSSDLSTISHGEEVRIEPEPEKVDAQELQRDRLTREVDLRNAYRQEQQRMCEERVSLEAKLPRVKLKGRRASVVAIEQRIGRLNGRIKDAA